MTISLGPKHIIGAVLVILAVGLVAAKLASHKNQAPSAQAIAACQKQVKSTYGTLQDTSSVVAPATGTSIQKQEDDALANCQK